MPSDSIMLPLSHRKQPRLVVADIPEGTTAIGDAAFSLCTSLKRAVLPASVESIGVAAFCGSGLEEVVFLGTPSEIHPSVFSGCTHLHRIIVPQGSKANFEILLPNEATLIVEAIDTSPTPVGTDIGLFGQTVARQCRITYNRHDFVWAVGDEVLLAELFSGPTLLNGDPSYQFRRKAIFVFMKSRTSSSITPVGKSYAIPANTMKFLDRCQEKYGTHLPRIFLFTCDDGKHAYFYDEVSRPRPGKNTIIVLSLVRL